MNPSTLDVPGATLYYEVRGTGPVLLLICGGVYDAALCTELAANLADRFTVVSYDRRGNSRSPLTGSPTPQDISTHADDAARLLAVVSPETPAAVFGNSSGAQIGLELVAQHSGRVAVLVAHEPPIWEVLPDGERLRTGTLEVADTYWAQGAAAAQAKFGALLGMAGSADEPFAAGELPPEMLEMFGRMAINNDFFLGYEIGSFCAHPVNLNALRQTSTRIVLAAGADSMGEPPHRAARRLAELLGTEAMILPGSHGGFASDPAGFGKALSEMLAATPVGSIHP